MKMRPLVYVIACMALPAFLLTYRVEGMSMTTSGRILVRETQREEALLRRTDAALRCTTGKKRIASELVAGRLSLCEAAEGFRELNALLDDGNDELLGTYQRASGEEDLFRNVLVWARGEALRDPARAPAVLSRLDREFKAHFGIQALPLIP